jgi:WD40 repeat protein
LRHDNWVYEAAFSPDAHRIVTASFDKSARVWDLASGQSVILEHDQAVRSADFSPDGRYVVTACWDYTVRLWDSVNGKQVMPPLRDSSYVMHASFSPDGRQILTTSKYGVVRVWDLAPNHWLPPSTTSLFSADGNRFATVSNQMVQLWDAVSSNACAASFVASNAVRDLKLTRDGRRALVISAATPSSNLTAQLARFEDIPNAGPPPPPIPLDRSASLLALSDNGQRLGVIVGKTAQTWDTTLGRALSPPLPHDSEINGASFSPDSARFVVISGTEAFVRDAVSGQTIFVLPHADTVTHAEFSPDGRRLVTASKAIGLADSEAQVWDAQTGQKVGNPLQHSDGVLHASFDPEGELVVTASEDKTAQMWFATTGQRRGPPLKHKDEVFTALFGPRGRWLVTACRDGTTRVWDAATSEPLTPPLLHGGPSPPLKHAQFIAQGRRVLSRKSGDAKVWELSPDDRPVHDLVLLMQLLCGHAGDQTGSLPLAKTALPEAWSKLRSAYPADFKVSAEERWFWHFREAEKAERARQWAAVVFHLDRLQETQPGDSALSERRARAQAALAQADQSPNP